jgi:hypothetical protein
MPRKSNAENVNAQLEQWAAGDPAKVVFAKQVAAAYAPGNNVSKEHLDAKFATYQKQVAQKSNTETAQQGN